MALLQPSAIDATGGCARGLEFCAHTDGRQDANGGDILVHPTEAFIVTRNADRFPIVDILDVDVSHQSPCRERPAAINPGIKAVVGSDAICIV